MLALCLVLTYFNSLLIVLAYYVCPTGTYCTLCLFSRPFKVFFPLFLFLLWSFSLFLGLKCAGLSWEGLGVQLNVGLKTRKTPTRRLNNGAVHSPAQPAELVMPAAPMTCWGLTGFHGIPSSSRLPYDMWNARHSPAHWPLQNQKWSMEENEELVSVLVLIKNIN